MEIENEKEINIKNEINNNAQGNVNNLKLNNHKKKQFWTWGCLIVFLIFGIISFFILSNFINFDFKFNLKNKEQKDFSSEIILNDYNAKRISKDQYLQQLIYAQYDRDKLEDKYRTGEPDLTSIDIFANFADDVGVSNETKELIKKYILLPDLTIKADKTFDSKGKSIATNNLDNNLFATKAFAAAPGVKKETTLNQRIYSSSGKFVVWFTEKGENKISKKYALKVVNDLDEVSNNYSDILSLSDNVKFQYSEGILKSKSKIFKESQGKIPVYLLNSKNSDTLAFYTPPMPNWVLALFPLMNNEIYNESVKGHQIFPFIQIKPSAAKDYSDTRSILSHELVHLAQDKNCRWDFKCHTAGPNSKFTYETTANWLAAKENPNATIFKRKYLVKYFSKGGSCSTDLSLLNNVGYCTYTFLEFLNNTNNVKELFNSHKESNPLVYLNKKIENFEQKFAKFAANNILNKFSNRSFIGPILPEAEAKKLISGERILPEASIHYYYLKTADFTNQIIKISDTSPKVEGQYLTILAKKKVSFRAGGSSKGYSQIYQNKLDGEFTFIPDNYKEYGSLAVILSNGDISNKASYKVNVIPIEISRNGDIARSSDCRQIGTYNSILEYFSRLPKIFSELAKANNNSVDANSLEKLSIEMKDAGLKQGKKGLIACRYPVFAKQDEKSVHDSIYNSYGGYKKTFTSFSTLDKDEYPNDFISLFSRFSFSDGFNLVFVHTNFLERGRLEKIDNKEVMGEFVNIRFENYTK